MGKGKLQKFADMATYPHVFEHPYAGPEGVPFAMKGQWDTFFFRNGRPLTLELGCGRGEYTVGLARRMPERNFIGIDIKGARMWTGATDALRTGLKNVAFLRTRIEAIDQCFAPGEVDELWLTFSDPQMKKATKRLTSTYFLTRYRRFLRDGGRIHVKTDSPFLYTYTRLMAEHNALPQWRCADRHPHLLRAAMAGPRHDHQVHLLPPPCGGRTGRAGGGHPLGRLPQLWPQQAERAGGVKIDYHRWTIAEPFVTD